MIIINNNHDINVINGVLMNDISSIPFLSCHKLSLSRCGKKDYKGKKISGVYPLSEFLSYKVVQVLKKGTRRNF